MRRGLNITAWPSAENDFNSPTAADRFIKHYSLCASCKLAGPKQPLVNLFSTCYGGQFIAFEPYNHNHLLVINLSACLPLHPVGGVLSIHVMPAFELPYIGLSDGCHICRRDRRLFDHQTALERLLRTSG